MVSKLQKLCRCPQLNGTCLVYYSLLVTMSHEVELNPGPRMPKYPSACCGKAVGKNRNSVQCDGCSSWHHIQCQGMSIEMHTIMVEHESYAWNGYQILTQPPFTVPLRLIYQTASVV